MDWTQLIHGLITLVAALGGVCLGARLNQRAQREQYDKRRVDQRKQNIRGEYAAWAGALLKEADGCRRLLLLKGELDQAISGSESPEPLKMHVAESMKEASMSALDATYEENVAFARIMLVDTHEGRVKRAHNVRMPLKKALTESVSNVNEVADSFFALEQRVAQELSTFLGEIAKELGD